MTGGKFIWRKIAMTGGKFIWRKIDQNHLTATPINLTRPLVSVWTVLAVTALKNEDAVLAGIESGTLLWAFDLAAKNTKTRLIRVLAASVTDFVEGNRPSKMSEADGWSRVARLIFPKPAPVLPATEIALAWTISSTHLLNLCDQGLLRLAKGTARHSGPGGSPLVEYQSAVDFLKSRRVY